MSYYSKNKSPLGYFLGEDNIDSYGVDHSGFSLRDELAYQIARTNQEDQMVNGYKKLGITKDYPQSTTDFWGDSSENNYGFGSSDISENIEKKKEEGIGNMMRICTEKNPTLKIAAVPYDTIQGLYANVFKKPVKYDKLSTVGIAFEEADRVGKLGLSDEDTHKYISCVGAFGGPLEAAAMLGIGWGKEKWDYYRKKGNPHWGTEEEILQDGQKDWNNDKIGVRRGISIKDINECSEFLPPNARKKLY